jgi:hypothetical protein
MNQKLEKRLCQLENRPKKSSRRKVLDWSGFTEEEQMMWFEYWLLGIRDPETIPYEVRFRILSMIKSAPTVEIEEGEAIERKCILDEFRSEARAAQSSHATSEQLSKHE